MNTVTGILELLELVVLALKAVTTGGTQADAQLADTLIQIVAKANSTYQAQVGQPIDPALLQPIQKLP